MRDDWEKKTGRIELRLPETKKKSFHNACEAQGDRPSSALRRFIDSYIRRADRDEFRHVIGYLGQTVRRHRSAFLSACALLFVVVGASIYWGDNLLAPKGYPKLEPEVFARFDSDEDGRLFPGDIRTDDHLVHRALDLDGSGYITLDEFISRANVLIGTMDVSVEEYQSNVALPADLQHNVLVTFSLTNPSSVMIQASEARFQERKGPDGYALQSFTGFDRGVFFNVVSLDGHGPLKPVSMIHGFGFHPRPTAEERL